MQYLKGIRGIYLRNDVTSCATANATRSSTPGRSIKDQLLDLVTKMSAWLTMLTCKYTAAVSLAGS